MTVCYPNSDDPKDTFDVNITDTGTWLESMAAAGARVDPLLSVTDRSCGSCEGYHTHMQVTIRREFLRSATLFKRYAVWAAGVSKSTQTMEACIFCHMIE